MIARWPQVPLSREDVVLPPEMAARICVRPPYFALSEVSLAGLELHATAVAESPAFSEACAMPAAELGRHAAIVGLTLAACHQTDDRRRYYLARRADCSYTANEAPYGAPVRFTGRLVDLDKRSTRSVVAATVGGEPLASFEITYTVLTEPAFERLFRVYRRVTPAAPSPYGALLTTAWECLDAQSAQQIVPQLPVEACVGHFDGYPALPVAVLMGQLSYLAGRLHGVPYRVVRGEVEASDLVWAGERALFLAFHDGTGGHPDAPDAQRYRCEAVAGDRQVASMTLWLESIPATFS